MSAILVKQHVTNLLDQPNSWFSNFITYLITHKTLSYIIYLLATLSEFVFIVGFFTKKFDRLLIVIFITFVALDYFLMEINYFSWIAFWLACGFPVLKDQRKKKLQIKMHFYLLKNKSRIDRCKTSDVRT